MTAGQKSRRLGGLALVAALAVLLLIVVVWRIVVPSSIDESSDPSYLANVSADMAAIKVDSEMEVAITAFCGDCHGMPRAECYPRDRWYHEVRKGYEFYARSGRTDLSVPPIEQTLAYYQQRAPAQIEYPVPEVAKGKLKTTFRPVSFPADPNSPFPPDFANFCWGELRPGKGAVLLACEMRLGLVAAVDLRVGSPMPIPLTRLNNPTHVEVTDMDRNQIPDLIVTDQGDYMPHDHLLGSVVWLRPQAADPQAYETIAIAEERPRVADAQPADFDGDGDIDLVVAEFGWRTTGSIALYRNESETMDQPRFVPEVIDIRPGAINVPVADFNGDGQPDFAAVVSQEYETIDIYLNQGDARFRRYTVWAGPDPMYGSSGIELVDLDGDEDVDILYTNGDSFDNSFVDPSHGVQWLENCGDMQFEYHRLTDLSGAYRAMASDIDLDGDQDVVAVAYLPSNRQPENVNQRKLDGIICLEQTAPGVFARHTLESGRPQYATLELADFDGDGDADFVVGPGPHVKREDRGAELADRVVE